MTRQEFLTWEQASRDTIDVKRCYVDIAGGDLIAGILLSQIMYWHLPAKDGGDKLRVEKDGETWLAKGRADWWDECRISPKQFDRASAILQKLGLIQTVVKRFSGNPTVHIRICWDTFLRDLTLLSMKVAGGNNQIPQRSITKLPKGEKQDTPKVNNQIAQTSISLTETSPKKTKENSQRVLPPAAAGALPEVKTSFSFQERKEPEKKEPRSISDLRPAEWEALEQVARDNLIGVSKNVVLMRLTEGKSKSLVRQEAQRMLDVGWTMAAAKEGAK